MDQGNLPKNLHGLRTAFRFLRPHWPLALLNLGLLLVLPLLEVASIGMVVPLLQSLGAGEPQGALVEGVYRLFQRLGIPLAFGPLLGIFSLLVALRYAVMALQQYLARLLGVTITHELRERLFQKYLALPLAFFYRQRVGDLTSALQHSTFFTGLVVEHLVFALSSGILAGALILLDLWISVPLTLLVLLLLAVAYVPLTSRLRKGFSRGEEARQLADQWTSFVVETLANLKVVKAFHNEPLHIRRFRELNQQLRRVSLKLQANQSLARLATEPLVFFLAVGVLTFALQALHLTLMEVVPFFLALLRVLPQFRLINQHQLFISEHLPHVHRVQHLLQVQVPAPVSGSRPLSTIHKGVEFRRVSFRYPGARAFVIREASFSLPKGRITALFGPSGEGKSTLVDLLLRLHDPTEGALLVDDTDLRVFRVEDWHRLLGFVPQESYWFHGTVYQNLLYGNPRASREEVIQAAQWAGAHAFIQRLPKGYDTVMGERGVTLSGGQLQRLALARALVRNPQILILDEATSALDSETEQGILETLLRLRPQRIIVLITHRVSTLRVADWIVVLQGGRVVDQGQPQELLQRCEVYRRNVLLQTGQGDPLL